MKIRASLIVSALALAAMCVLIFAMSSQPADDSTELSMGVVWHIIGFIVPGYDQMSAADQLYWQQALDHPVRKTAHFIEYAILGALAMNFAFQVARARSGAEMECPKNGTYKIAVSIPKLAFASWASGTLFAVSDEIHQVFVPGRAGMPSDILLDSAGVLIGVALVALIVSRRRNAEKS